MLVLISLYSAGIGRTGVFISSDIGMKHLEENREVDILKIVSMLRQDRGGMVQTVSQYHFVYKVLLYEPVFWLVSLTDIFSICSSCMITVATCSE